MMLADRLKKSVQEILQLTTLEIEMWAGYLMYEDQESKKTMRQQKQQMRARKR
tara:strand:- start:261 stop:419 length:159 start_codon:yes stop_codon:yes gene_type:complete